MLLLFCEGLLMAILTGIILGIVFGFVLLLGVLFYKKHRQFFSQFHTNEGENVLRSLVSRKNITTLHTL